MRLSHTCRKLPWVGNALLADGKLKFEQGFGNMLKLIMFKLADTPAPFVKNSVHLRMH